MPLIVLASNVDARLVLHELGHAHDWKSRFSNTAAWREIHACIKHRALLEPDLPVFGGDYFHSNEGESFAEAFAKYFDDDFSRGQLPLKARDFIESSVK
jgi:hypothetical protein